jgi:hypothetical protein
MWGKKYGAKSKGQGASFQYPATSSLDLVYFLLNADAVFTKIFSAARIDTNYN